MTTPSPKCQTCEKSSSSSPGLKLFKCAQCLQRTYCSQDCQMKDWRTHKKTCGRKNVEWWDTEAIRQCDDGNAHEGKLELITWGGESEGYMLGWGAVAVEECEEFRRRFETEMNRNEKKLYKEWPRAFRWTCCGNAADNTFGCDHHGKGRKACTCDFCRMGKPLTENVYENLKKSVHGKGLDLRRGPDKRSYNPQIAGINERMRGAFGMDN